MSEDKGQNDGPTGKLPRPTQKNGTLLRLSDHSRLSGEQMLTEVRAYWNTLRRDGQAVPARSDVQPEGLRRALDYSFLVERIAPGAARFRLAGRHLIDLMGMEVRGMPLCAFLNPNSRGKLSDILESVFRGPQIVDMMLLSPANYGRPTLPARLLILPLRSDLGDVTRALGCLIADGEPGQTPRRFDMVHYGLEPIIPGGSVLEPTASAAGFAEPPQPWVRPAPRTVALVDNLPVTPEERRAGFRIISSDQPVTTGPRL